MNFFADSKERAEKAAVDAAVARRVRVGKVDLEELEVVGPVLKVFCSRKAKQNHALLRVEARERMRRRVRVQDVVRRHKPRRVAIARLARPVLHLLTRAVRRARVAHESIRERLVPRVLAAKRRPSRRRSKSQQCQNKNKGKQIAARHSSAASAKGCRPSASSPSVLQT
eukprot:Amastigsp_a2803_52.p3 type:complete len:169 gc:universal Amastigsp_a2803_52:664-158(-)